MRGGPVIKASGRSHHTGPGSDAQSPQAGLGKADSTSTARLEFRVLGPVEVLRDGENITVGRGSLNLLARLLVSANTFVSADALAEAAWGQSLPTHPRAALQSTIARLRRLLGDKVVQTAREAYRLRADADQLDLLRFEQLVSRASATDCEEEAATTLAQAIGLWRGDPLANTDLPLLAGLDILRLTERYLAACEQWAQVSLRLGHAAEVVQQIAPVVSAHPFHEQMVRLLMLGFCQDGRQADALMAYDSLRRRLREGLGIDPADALQDLHAAILRGTPVEPRPQPSPEQPRSRRARPLPSSLVRRDSNITVLAQTVPENSTVTAAERQGAPGAGRPAMRRPQAREQSITPSWGNRQFTELHLGPIGEVRVALDPFVSTLALTIGALGRRRAAAQPWRRRILAMLSPPGVTAMLPMTAPDYSVAPNCVTPLNPVREVPLRVQVEWLHSMPEDDLLSDIHSAFETPPPHWRSALERPRNWLHAYANAIADAWRSVEPLWVMAQPMLEREVMRVGAAAVRGGLDLILDRLHPASQFGNNVLRIRDPEPASFELAGRPLVLVPMLSGVQALICNLDRTDAVWIAYPLPRPGNHAETDRRAASGPLEALTGPLRAQILRAVERPRTMSDLSTLLRLAPNALAYHCERLAAAGLVQREDKGRETWITQTGRGARMVALFTEVC
jgi:DNA-binding SARP family transcriptional activator